MQTAAIKMSARSFCAARCKPRSVQRVTRVVRATKETGDRFMQHAKLPLAAMCAAALLTGAMVPDEALAARTAGRVGGSSFSARRSAPAAPSRGATTGRRTGGSSSPRSSIGGSSVTARRAQSAAPSGRAAAGSRLTGSVGAASFANSRDRGSSGPTRSTQTAVPFVEATVVTAGPTINNYYAPSSALVAPPLVGGFGFPGFGFPGFGYGGVTVVAPGFGMFGSLFQLFFLVITLSFVFNVIKSFLGGSGKKYDD